MSEQNRQRRSSNASSINGTTCATHVQAFEILPTLLDCVYGPAVDDRCRTLPYREHLSPA